VYLEDNSKTFRPLSKTVAARRLDSSDYTQDQAVRLFEKNGSKFLSPINTGCFLIVPIWQLTFTNERLCLWSRSTKLKEFTEITVAYLR